MAVYPCPICRKPVHWESSPTRPFCSDRCKILDLGAWSAEAYRVPEKPEESQGESWSAADEES